MDDNTSAPFALVVDDSAFILIEACSILEDAGFRSLEASDAEEAIVQLEEYSGSIALLFTDVDMPGTRDGFDLARETAKRWPDIGILIASGAREPSKGDLPPGAHFIRKPFSATVVYDRLEQLLPDGKKPEPLKQRRSR